MSEPRITVYSKPGCHLCDNAKIAVERISAQTGAGWIDIDIANDPALMAEYGEMIPVIVLDGRVHGYWRVEEDRLLQALQRAR
jgi:glutaredoxin